MARKLEPPAKLTAAHYEWESLGGDDEFGPPPRKWSAWSRAYSDDGAPMHYQLRRTMNGRFTLWFEGGRLGPKDGYMSMGRAAAAIAKSENRIRDDVYRERLTKAMKRYAKTGKYQKP